MSRRQRVEAATLVTLASVGMVGMLRMVARGWQLVRHARDAADFGALVLASLRRAAERFPPTYDADDEYESMFDLLDKYCVSEETAERFGTLAPGAARRLTMNAVMREDGSYYATVGLPEGELFRCPDRHTTDERALSCARRALLMMTGDRA